MRQVDCSARNGLHLLHSRDCDSSPSPSSTGHRPRSSTVHTGAESESVPGQQVPLLAEQAEEVMPLYHSVLEEPAAKVVLLLALKIVMFAEGHCTVVAEPGWQQSPLAIHNAVQSSRFLFLCSARTSETKSGLASEREASLKSPDRRLLHYSVGHKRCLRDHIVSCRLTADRSSCHWSRTEATLEIAASMSDYNPTLAGIRQRYEDVKVLP